MSVELPYAPVDAIIRRNADGLRVSAEATEALARELQFHGATLGVAAAANADADGRKTLMEEDFPVEHSLTREELTLPIAPVDRIARLEIEDRYLVSMDARVALATVLERYADEVAEAATLLAEHAERRTISEQDIRTYLSLCGDE